MSLEFKICVSKSDLRRALLSHQFGKTWTYCFIGFGNALLLASIWDIVHRHSPSVAGLFVGMMWILLPFLLWVSNVRHATRTPDSLATALFTFDDKGIRRTTRETLVDVSWNIIDGWRDTADSVLVLVAEHCLFVIPKRQLSDKLLHDLRSALADRLPKH